MDAETCMYILMEVVIAIMAITGNALVCYVVIQSAGLRRKVMYMFVTSLAVADIFVGTFAIPFAILTKLGLPHGSPRLCMLMLSFIMIPTQISIFNMMAVAVERYVAIRFPRIHYAKLTKSRCMVVIVFTWFLSTAIGMLPLLGWNKVATQQTKTAHELPHQAASTSVWTNYTTDLPSRYFMELEGTENPPEIVFEKCEFMKVMDPDYMFFNFAACVLPPLLTSAVLYSIIFAAFVRASRKREAGTSSAGGGIDSRSAAELSPTSGRELATPVPSPPPNRREFSACGKNNKHNNSQKRRHFVSIDQQHPLNNDNEHQEVGCDNNDSGLPYANVRVEVEPPSSSAVIIQQSLVQLDGSITISDKRGKSLSNGSIDSNLLRVRLESLEKLQDSHSAKEISKDIIPELRHRQSSGYNSANSSVSQSPIMRPRSGTNGSYQAKRCQERRHRKRRREFKAAAVLCLIVFCFAVCWIPIHTLNTINWVSQGRVNEVPSILYSIAILLSHANSAINFFLYSWRLQAFRSRLNKLVLKRIHHRFQLKS